MTFSRQPHRFQKLGFGRVACGALLVLCCAFSTVSATDHADAPYAPQKPQSCERQLDSLWLVSTRHLCCPEQCPLEDVDLHVEQCYGEQGWEESDLASLLQASRNTLTVIHVPGNRADWDTAITEGKAVRDMLVRYCPAEPITFVIWSWPSDRIPGLVRDFRVKASRADCDGVYLAWFLARLDERRQDGDSRISLTGYSYGARIAIGALHAWNGGGLAGVRLPDSDVVSGTTVRVVFIAAAEHNYWLQPGSVHGLAYDRFDYALNLYNSCDRALQRYRIVERCGRAQALGYTGLAGRSCFDDGAERLHEYDCCCHVGKPHDIAHYLFDDVLAEKISRYATWGGVEW